jgi:hypothetical protein
MAAVTAFSTERELVGAALDRLPFREWLGASASSPLFLKTEVQGLFGVPDVVAATDQPDDQAMRSIAFEMKLSDWRRGLAQAFRYRAFAAASVLVIDAGRIGPAAANLERFKRANVGLVAVSTGGGFEVLFWPNAEEPFSPALAESFAGIVAGAFFPPQRRFYAACRPRQGRIMPGRGNTLRGRWNHRPTLAGRNCGR